MNDTHPPRASALALVLTGEQFAGYAPRAALPAPEPFRPLPAGACVLAVELIADGMRVAAGVALADSGEDIANLVARRVGALLGEVAAQNVELSVADQAVLDCRGQRAGGRVPDRNQPCPCGTGRKYKHCHGRGEHPVLYRQHWVICQRDEWPEQAARFPGLTADRRAPTPGHYALFGTAFCADGTLIGEFSGEVDERHDPWTAIATGGGRARLDAAVNTGFGHLRDARVLETYEQAPDGWAARAYAR